MKRILVLFLLSVAWFCILSNCSSEQKIASAKTVKKSDVVLTDKQLKEMDAVLKTSLKNNKLPDCVPVDLQKSEKILIFPESTKSKNYETTVIVNKNIQMSNNNESTNIFKDLSPSMTPQPLNDMSETYYRSNNTLTTPSGEVYIIKEKRGIMQLF